MDDWNRYQLAISDKQKDYDHVENNELIVFIYGYPFNPESKKWVSGKDVCLLYPNEDLEFIHEIDGVYSILIMDKEKKKTIIITDRYGIYNLFYFKDEDRIVVSDKIAEMVPFIDDVKLNEQSIIEYMFFGFKLGDKTHFMGVKEFEGATIYIIDPNMNLTKTVYWDLIGNAEKSKMEKESFRNLFNNHIRTAFELEKNVNMPLSGGLDTRAILSAAINQNLMFECYTYGIKNSPDVKIAKRICRHLNIKHRLFEIDQEWIENIPSAFEKGSKDYNGLIPPYSSINQRSFEDYCKDCLILMGVLGNEIWRGLLAEKRMEMRSEEEILDIILSLFTHNKSRLLKIFNGYRNIEIMKKIERSLEKEMFTPNSNRRPIDQFEAFVLKSWGSNWAGNAFKAAGRYFKVYSAYLNKDLLPLVVLQERNERLKGYIQKYIISENNPYLATVKLDTTDIRHGAAVNNKIGSKVRDIQAMIPHYSKAAVNYIPKRLLRRHIFKTPFFTDYPKWLRDYHKDFIIDVLDHEKMYTRDMIKKERLEEIIQLFLNGDDSQEQCITRLMGLELWLLQTTQSPEVNVSYDVTSNNKAMSRNHEILKTGEHG
jgi:hypothetical protein